MQTEINSELNKVKLWLKLNKLSLNTNKTKLMVFHRKQKQIKNINNSINNIQIERVHSFSRHISRSNFILEKPYDYDRKQNI